MATKTDVVIVGGGIGGASLAGALVREGVGVTVLETTVEYPDRVRGESLQAWGVHEAQVLGVESVLMDAGAHIASVWKIFGADGEEQQEVPMSIMVEGVSGSLNLRHPVACQALIEHAAEAGATVVRGVSDLIVEPGASPRVTFTHDGNSIDVSATLIVGADGRGSAVRRAAGISLERQDAISYIAGLLVEGLDATPGDHDLLCSDDGQYSLLFRQQEGRGRVYLCTGVSGQHAFSGSDGTERFLAACRRSVHAAIAACGAAEVAGPCANYAGTDTWTDAPYAEGVVLIGDAAGHNDPIIGQGLSIALRDARSVRDLVLDGARTTESFAPYGEERTARMARLRLMADILAVAQAEDADNQPARRAAFFDHFNDPGSGLAPLMVGAFAGPETVPDELVDFTWPDRLRAA